MCSRRGLKKSATSPGRGRRDQLTDAIARLMAHGAVYAYQYSGKRYDCGSKGFSLKRPWNWRYSTPRWERRFGSTCSNCLCDQCMACRMWRKNKWFLLSPRRGTVWSRMVSGIACTGEHDFTSQWVFEELVGAAAISDYLRRKMHTVRARGVNDPGFACSGGDGRTSHGKTAGLAL